MMGGLVAGTGMAGSPGALSPLEDFVFTPKPQGLGYLNQRALADALHRQRPNFWKKESLKSQISKFFKFALPLNANFTNVLLALTHGDLRAGLLRAIEQHEEEYQRRDDPIQIMRARYSTSKQLFFLGLEPISANLDSAPPSLVELLGFSFQEIVSGNLSVTMVVPSREIANGIWAAVSGLAEQRANASPDLGTAAELLAIADQKFVLLTLPRHMCVHTTVAFDPDLPTGAGYIWYMPWDWRTPVKMPPKVLDAWKTEFLKPIVDRKLDGKPILPITRT